MMSEFAKGYAAIGNVSIIGGAGEDGASNVVGADNAKALKSVFDSVSSATGLDLAAIIQGQAVGRGIGDGFASAQGASSRSATTDAGDQTSTSGSPRRTSDQGIRVHAASAPACRLGRVRSSGWVRVG